MKRWLTQAMDNPQNVRDETKFVTGHRLGFQACPA